MLLNSIRKGLDNVNREHTYIHGNYKNLPNFTFMIAKMISGHFSNT